MVGAELKVEWGLNPRPEQSRSMETFSVIGLLGRRDHPTDALEDYSFYLGQALARRGIRWETVRVPWAEVGWSQALRWLRRAARSWHGRWVIVQYTALQWSRRGFPLGLLGILRILHQCRIPGAVVFHDASPYEGTRKVDRVRRACQRWVMQYAYHRTAWSFLTVPPERVDWLPRPAPKAVYLPVGANIPEPPQDDERENPANPHKTVVVFGISEDLRASQEVSDIAYVVTRVHQALSPHRLCLTVFGRGSQEAEPRLRELLKGHVEVRGYGLIPADQITRILCRADAMLFVRGSVSTRRGSAMAAIACGVPLVGYAGKETGPPLTDAGVVLVPEGDREGLVRALTRVLIDLRWWNSLRERNRWAQRTYFSWDRIADRLCQVLDSAGEGNPT